VKSGGKKDTRRLLLLIVVALLVFVGSLFRQDVTPDDSPAPDAAVDTPVLTLSPEAGGEAAGEEDGALPDYAGDFSYTGDEPEEDGTYSGTEDVAYYLHVYGHLPNNYITKDEAEDAGWISSEGNLWEVAYGASIGGDRFGNREGLLPEGEQYYECDVNYSGGYRGEERLVYTDDGDVYYTADHYESFEKLY